MTHRVLQPLAHGHPGHGAAEPASPAVAQSDAATAGIKARRSSRHSDSVQQDSVWSNLKYGLGMLLFCVIPPLLPGVTVRHLVIAYSAIVLAVYLLAFVIVLVRTMRSQPRHQPR